MELSYDPIGSLFNVDGEITMIDHTGIGVADVRRSAAFYDAALGALGLRRVVGLPAHDGSEGVAYGTDYRLALRPAPRPTPSATPPARAAPAADPSQ